MNNFSLHFPVLMVIVLILGAGLTPIIGFRRWGRSSLWTIFIISVSLLMCIFVASKVSSNGPLSYRLGGWEPLLGIEIYFDYLSLFAVVVLAIGLLIVVFSHKYLEKYIEERKRVSFYTLFLLIMAGMVGFVIAGDLFNFYIFVEIFSLASYALVALGKDRLAPMAAFKYLLMSGVASLSILLGIIFLYSLTGTLNMQAISKTLSLLHDNHVATLGLSLLVTGFAIKSALFPLHVWLPDAHSYAPSPVSAVLSGLFVKIGIIGMVRVVFGIYKITNFFKFEFFTEILLFLGCSGIFAGTIFALLQDDIKRMLAYSTIANMGYIVFGLSFFSYQGFADNGFVGALMHLLNHSLGKATLFLCAGTILYKTGTVRLSKLKGIAGEMPITMWCMALSILSILGFPPMAGFVSKWYIARGTIEAGKPILTFLFLSGSIFNATYYYKIINTFFFKKQETTADEGLLEIDDSLSESIVSQETQNISFQVTKRTQEAPWSMLVPMVVLSIASLMVGIFAYIPLRYVKLAISSFK